jgi:hypothetical protein
MVKEFIDPPRNSYVLGEKIFIDPIYARIAIVRLASRVVTRDLVYRIVQWRESQSEAPVSDPPSSDG